MSGGSFVRRTATVVVALPAIFLLVFLLPQHNHLAMSIGTVLVAALGARELEKLLAERSIPSFACLFPFAALIPAAAYFQTLGLLSRDWSLGVPTALVVLVLLRSLWVPDRRELGPLLQRVSGSLLVLFYPALLLSFIVKLAGLANSRWILLYFFSINIANDTLAYVAGMSLGQGTRLHYSVSPNKSAVGFGAGILSSVGVALLFKALKPDLLPVGYGATVGFGVGAGALTIAGDLVESALKRSARVKDSGGIIPGRGGILDSIDSWLLTAPLFYFVFLGISR
jgi:phosphatidate cytidylyltransferase